MAKAVRKLVDDTRKSGHHELDLDAKGLSDLLEFPELCMFVLFKLINFDDLFHWYCLLLVKCTKLTRLTLSHNKITGIISQSLRTYGSACLSVSVFMALLCCKDWLAYVQVECI